MRHIDKSNEKSRLAADDLHDWRDNYANAKGESFAEFRNKLAQHSKASSVVSFITHSGRLFDGILNARKEMDSDFSGKIRRMNNLCAMFLAKTPAVARVFLKKGKGDIIVNGKDYKEYFAAKHLLHNITDPFEAVELMGQFDVTVNATGGGIKGQAEAVKMGISRCLVKMNEELKPLLKAKGYMTRDSRMVERKKFGLRKARRATQFSKR